MKALVLDLSGVVFVEASLIRKTLYPMLPSGAPHYDTVKAAYLNLSLGKIPEDEFWRTTGGGPELKQRFLDSMHLNPQAKPLMDEARRKGILVCALSNHVSSWVDYLSEKFSLRWDYLVVSDEAGVRKPEKEIYEIFLKRTEISAKDCLFIDDKADNLVAARELGFNCALLEDGQRRHDFNPQVKTLTEIQSMLI
ncbi:Phosphoglycolate phosphatase [uncultured archaeon]|nr:Phosphoglycolate phosphatase [uncultured archaeon]